MMRAIVNSTLLVLTVLLALAALFEVIGELDDVQNAYQTPQVILFAALRLPNLAFEMLPVSVLIGSLLGLGGLAANSEIIVMRSAGLSVARLAAMVGVTGAVLLVVTGLIGEFIGPPLDYYARNMRTEARIGQEDERFGNDTWVRDGRDFLHLERVSNEFEFGKLIMFRLREDGSLASILRAENAGIDESDEWVLENIRETQFRNDRVQVAEATRTRESIAVNAELLGSAMAKSSSLSARGLLSYIDYLDRNNLDSRNYKAELWYRASRTTAVLVMPVLALAFVFGSLRSGSAGGRLLIGVVIGLGYYLASEMLSNSGQVFSLNPAVVAWLPTIVLIALTWGALSRVR